MAKTATVILAAGRGTRAGGDIPKQYRPLGGRPMLRRTIETFLRHPAIDSVRTVIHEDDISRYEHATQGLPLPEPVIGGETRQDSSRNGLESLSVLAPERVLIHDAARPFVDAGTIDRVIAALDHHPAAIAAVAACDTIKRATAEGTVAATLDRSSLWLAQTPQGFRYREILAAHRQLSGQGLTDDAAVAEAAGLSVALVEGSENNFKITTAEDLARAERLVGGMDLRVGYGFDVHRFAPGDHVMLCGVRIACERGLAGHSDADVGLHALTDAVLGAIGAGDIGAHFPPSDPEWADANSSIFLARACELVAARGGEIRHLDLTLVCERPKIGPHRRAMIVRVAEIAGVEASRVSIKATTTERLGFLGRSEGIAAQAVATVRL